MYQIYITLLLSASVTAAQQADPFSVPATRGESNHVYAEWDFFFEEAGPNQPDVALNFAGVDILESSDDGSASVAQGFNAFDNNQIESGSFVTSTFNIYSFDLFPDDDITGIVQPRVEFQSFGQGYGFKTTVLYQVRTLGNVPDLATFFVLEQTAPLSATTLLEETNPNVPVGLNIAGGVVGFYSAVFEIPRDRPESRVDFSAAGSSMSFTRAILDITVDEMDCPVDLTLDAEVNFLDFLVLLRDADFGMSPLGSVALGDGDWNGDGQLTPADFKEYLTALEAGCP